MGIIASSTCSHDITATQLLEQSRQTSADDLLNLVVVVVVLLWLVLLSTVLLLSAVLLLPAVLLPTVLSAMLSRVAGMLTAMLSTMLTTRVSTLVWLLRRRRHVANLSTLQVHIDATLVLLCRILKSKVATHLFDARLDLLDMVAAVVALADNNVKVRLASASCCFDPLL
jgi:hypothetical protein